MIAKRKGVIAFTFPPECRSASLRNRVRMRPDSSRRCRGPERFSQGVSRKDE